MPCRALEAFRPGITKPGLARHHQGLNALSGIGGVQTECVVVGSEKGKVWS